MTPIRLSSVCRRPDAGGAVTDGLDAGAGFAAASGESVDAGFAAASEESFDAVVGLAGAADAPHAASARTHPRAIIMASLTGTRRGAFPVCRLDSLSRAAEVEPVRQPREPGEVDLLVRDLGEVGGHVRVMADEHRQAATDDRRDRDGLRDP